MEWLKGLYIGATIFGAGVTLADIFGMLSNIGSSDGGDDGTPTDAIDADDGSIVGHDRRITSSPVLAILTALRTLVHFSLGFGLVGWFAMSQYSSAATTLLWSLPTGVVAAVGARLLRSFMGKELSSTITRTDLLMEKGVVTVSIKEGGTGRVRVTFGGVYFDRYAQSADRSISIPVGFAIRVVDADDEYVYVEPEGETRSS